MQKQLTFGDKCIYGVAGIGDGTIYTFLSTFLMFFLTSVAGMQPAAAGFVAAIGTICDMLAGPVVGCFSDNCTSRFGKRRPFIFCGAIPLAITTAMLFTYVDLGPAMKMVYYSGIIILFWGSFSCYFVPYTALGAEMTTDYNERIVLRSFTSVCNSTGNLIGTVIPSVMIDYFMNAGHSAPASWSMVGIFIGVFSGGTILVTAIGTRKKDKPAKPSSDREKFSIKGIGRTYLEILKLKPMRILVVVSIISLTGLTVCASDRLYFLTYYGEFSAKQTSFILLMGCLTGFLAPPTINFITKFLDKKQTFILVMTIFVVALMIFSFWDIHEQWKMLIVVLFFGMGYMAYWQLMPALLYDICEYDEYINGKKRSGQILSLQGIAEGVAEALGAQLLGIILQIFGFVSTSDSQPDSALTAINICMFVVPAVLILISCIFMWRYPISKEKYEEIKKALEEQQVTDNQVTDNK